MPSMDLIGQEFDETAGAKTCRHFQSSARQTLLLQGTGHTFLKKNRRFGQKIGKVLPHFPLNVSVSATTGHAPRQNVDSTNIVARISGH